MSRLKRFGFKVRISLSVLAMLVLLCLPARSYGQPHVQLLYGIDNPYPNAGDDFGNSLEWIGDVNGDGDPDLLVGSVRDDVYTPGDELGRAFVFSGADGALLMTINPPSPSDRHFGNWVSAPGDVNGDTIPDFTVDSVDTNRVYVFSGAGAVDPVSRLYLAPPLHTFQGSGKFGVAHDGVGDVNGDGFPDLIVGAQYANRAYVFSGSDGASIYTFSGSGFFGGRLGGLDDVNADGVPDIGVSAQASGQGGQVFVYSGNTGALLYTIPHPSPQSGANFGGGAFDSIGDVDGDGVADIFTGAPAQNVGGFAGVGQAYIFSGVDGSWLVTLDNPDPQQNTVFLGNSQSAGVGDMDGDGVPDLLVTAYGQDVGGNTDQGQAWVFSGANGSVLLPVTHPEPQAGAFFGQRFSTLPMGPGQALVAIGAHEQDTSGKVYVFSVPGLEQPTPRCDLTAVNPGPPKSIDITAQAEAGLDHIAVRRVRNATVTFPPLKPGTTEPIVITATKLDQSTWAKVLLEVIDQGGRRKLCE